MKPAHAQFLMRQFIRDRQNWFLGPPSEPLYTPAELDYFEMLERDRLAGKLHVEGTIRSLADYADPDLLP